MDPWRKASDEVDALIELRAGERAREMVWQERVRAHYAKRREENRQAWLHHHQHMEALHLSLAGEHAAKAERLLENEESA